MWWGFRVFFVARGTKHEVGRSKSETGVELDGIWLIFTLELQYYSVSFANNSVPLRLKE
jgi:hypothetical protein